MHDPCPRQRPISHGARRTFSGLALAVVGALAAGVPGAGAAPLPDGRAYELVSPSNDRLGDVLRMPGVADHPDVVAFMSSEGASDAQSVVISSTSVARRAPSGWSLTNADVPVARSGTGLGQSGPVQFSPDFNRVVSFLTLPVDDGDQDGYQGDYYRFDVSSKAADWISHGTTIPDTAASGLWFMGSSLDLERSVFYMDSQQLIPGGPTIGIYARDADGLELVSILPDGTPASFPQPVADLSYAHSTDFINSRGARAPHGGIHPISDDAQRIFFIDYGTGGIYVRDGDYTAAVSASHRAGEEGTTVFGASFIWASPDGSEVYFHHTAQLTDDAPEGGAIYRYDVESGELTVLTPPASDPSGPMIQSANMSADGSHLYFIGFGALTPEAGFFSPNLYVWTPEDGTRFVKTVGFGDTIARTSRDGRYALITSGTSIDGAPTNGFQAVYRYDDGTGDFDCVSCRPDGSNNQGDARIEAQNIVTGIAAQYSHPRNLTDDGRVFFTTTDKLVPRDTAAGADVYEYHDGTVSLVSSGDGDSDSFLQDNSDDGRDVFFLTRSRLTAGDKDANQLDLYDARVGGGFPEPAPSRGCTGDDCQAPAGGRPAVPSPGSTTANGPGNAKPVPTAKPAARRSIRLSRLSAAARRQLARTGTVVLSVRVTRGGKVTVRAKDTLGRGSATLGSATRTVQSKGALTAHVRLRLSAAARRQLAQRGRLRMTIEAHLSGVSGSSRFVFTLTSAKR